MMEERDDLRKQDRASPRLSTMNDEITKATSDHKRRQWREFVKSIDHRTDSTMLWRTIKRFDGNSKLTEKNEGITFIGRPYISAMLIANSFNRQFTTSKLGKHSTSRRTHQVPKDVKRNRSPATRSPVQSRAVGIAEHVALTLSVIPIPQLGKDSYRPISLLCPAAKVLEASSYPHQ